MTFHLTAALRSANAHKAAASRKARGEKPFGGHHGHGGFGHETAAQRSANAKKAAVSRKAHGTHVGHKRPHARASRLHK